MINYTLVDTPSALAAFLSNYNDQPVGLDIETVGFDPRKGRIRLVQLGLADGNNYVIDCDKIPNVESLVQKLTLCIGHNLKFEIKWFLHHHNLVLSKVFDTYRASSILYNGLGYGHNLYEVYKRELNLDPPTEDLGGSDWTGELSPAQLQYAASDVAYMHRLKEVLEPKIAAAGLSPTLALEHSVIAPEAEMELTGFAFDKEAWLTLAENNQEIRFQLQDELYDLLPNPSQQLDLFNQFGRPNWNLDSPLQLKKSLAMAGIHTESTNEMVLAQIDHPLISKIIEYRGYVQRVKSFGIKWLDNVDDDGRVRTHFFPFTDTGRYASSKPNLTQIPREKAYRSCFIAKSGYKLVVADYSQVELRIAAELSQDPTMLKAYKNNEDLHTITARIATGKEDITKEDRQIAKSINFGLLYGMGAEKYTRYAKANYGVTVTLEEANIFKARYFNHYKGIKKWHRRALQASKDRLTRSIGGRLRHMEPDVYNEYMNSGVQSTGGDAIKRSLALLYKSLKPYDAKLVLSVHDELIVECREEQAVVVKAIVERDMKAALQFYLKKVPSVVEAGIGTNWAEAK